MSNSIRFTNADRGPDGRLLVEPPMERIRRLQAELEGAPEQPATPAAPEQPAEIRPQLPTATYRQLFGALAIVAVMALAAWIAFRPSGAPTAQPTANPAGVVVAPPSAAPAATKAPPTVMAYAAPGGALLGPIDPATPTYRHSDYPGWAGIERRKGEIVWVKADPGQIEGLPDLAEPTPAPTPVYIKVEVPVEVTPACDIATNPRYSVTIEVFDDKRTPLGFVTGNGCASQAEAQRNAEDAADAMKKGATP